MSVDVEFIWFCEGGFLETVMGSRAINDLYFSRENRFMYCAIKLMW